MLNLDRSPWSSLGALFLRLAAKDDAPGSVEMTGRKPADVETVAVVVLVVVDVSVAVWVIGEVTVSVSVTVETDVDYNNLISQSHLKSRLLRTLKCVL